MAQKLDAGVERMSLGERGKEIMRLRAIIRTHKKANGNARCWLLDEWLYEQALPEGGRVASPALPSRTIFLGNCERYYNRQCPISFVARCRALREQALRKMKEV